MYQKYIRHLFASLSWFNSAKKNNVGKMDENRRYPIQRRRWSCCGPTFSSSSGVYGVYREYYSP
ncbi:hypothetical protein AFLA_003811 [Aspergillus flavus NRRL3357]|nr:hypothetical protein AFLA_003811 [Aspergillus flavus NRRL3357]